MLILHLGFVTILEQFKEAISKLRQYREALATGHGEGRGGVPPPRVIRIMGYSKVGNLDAL